MLTYLDVLYITVTFRKKEGKEENIHRFASFPNPNVLLNKMNRGKKNRQKNGAFQNQNEAVIIGRRSLRYDQKTS